MTVATATRKQSQGQQSKPRTFSKAKPVASTSYVAKPLAKSTTTSSWKSLTTPKGKTPSPRSFSSKKGGRGRGGNSKK